MRFVSLGLLLIMIPATAAFAIGTCSQNNAGHIVCAPPGGSIMMNKDGIIVCGRGRCVVDKSGIILCSSQPGGAAMIDNLGTAVCAGGCISASASNCKGAR
jgi:hypothetical protein